MQVGNFISYGVCKFICLSSFMSNRFHKELRFFFSLLKRKKEAKKEKSSHSTCTVRFKYHPKITQEILTNKTPPEGHTGGCCRRNITLFTLEIGGGKVSGDSPPPHANPMKNYYFRRGALHHLQK